MGKRRTKKEKIIARLRRQVKTQQKTKTIKKTIPDRQEKTEPGSPPACLSADMAGGSRRTWKKDDIFGYDPSLIKKDLQKTLLLSVIFIITVLGIWLWQQNNWWLPKF